ncbi:MAG: DUF1592 domain-containing protein [Opitutaceae bacterium]|nr:DUF1592 domain-containing protein [Opitutaceae bacterium]
MSATAPFFTFALVSLIVASPLCAADAAIDPVRSLVGKYCLDCHDAGTKKGGLSLENLDTSAIPAAAPIWEEVARKLAHRQMPPLGEARPDNADYNRVVAALTSSLDRAAAAQPNPGRTDTFRRLNRTEYQNAIRDLLGVAIDATALLPNEEPSHGFDNVAVGNLSPTLLDRYVSAAQKIARLAVGTPRKAPGGDTFRVRPDVTQEEHVEGLPLGTRGGILIPYLFPQDGDYEVAVRLQRDRNEQVEGLRRPHEVEVLLNRERVAVATVKPPGADKNAEAVDRHLTFRLAVKAGPHDLGVTFPKDPSVVLENERAPFAARFNMHRHPRTAPAVFQVTITGPFDAKGSGDTPSRRLIFGDLAGAPSVEKARTILAKLARRAYRRPVTDEDLRRPMQFFHEGSAEGAGFEAGIEHAITAILVSPQFLFRIEADPAGIAPGSAYHVSDLELASRLSFFLWGSIPDDALLDAAEGHELRQPAQLAAHVRRMLADERADNLVNNFAAQWLHLRGLAAITPDARRFIDFDENLRQSMRRETELFFAHIMRQDRPITELIGADYTFLDERLARHYKIPHVFGSHFRPVSFAGDPQRQRGGLLRHGSILTVTSYATRTSPVIRGHWILANLIGEPPPPPPPNVPSLDEGVVSATLPIRQRLAKHRENPACASCHNVMDPVGFSLENFDAVGRWRSEEDHRPVDVSGGLSDGSTFEGVAGLERALLARPELFVETFAEKLLIFALGRGVEPFDGPALRDIVRRAHADDFRFSTVILGIVNSVPFQMRKSP